MANARPGTAQLVSLASLLLLSLPSSAADNGVSWHTRIQPLLDTHCVKCHGPIEQKAGIELDNLPAVLKGGESGPIVKPGNPEASPLLTVLSEGSDPHMPPKKQLSTLDREAIRQWIANLSESPTIPTGTVAASPETRVFNDIPTAINTLVQEGWARRAIKPSAPLSDSTWLRRAALDLVGRIPTPQESEAFTRSTAPDKRGQAVQRLLDSAEYPIRMRELWDNFLMGRPKRGSSEDRRKQSGWYGFLESAFQANQPWNRTVHQILTGRGDRPETKGSTWFLYERKNDHQAIAEAVAPLIYGTRMDCAQCHDHPLAREIKQSHYWGIVTAFNRSKNVDGSNGVAESAVGGFVNFTNLKKESQPAIITLLNGRTVTETWPAGDHKPEDKDDLYVDAKAKVRVPLYSRRETFADIATDGNTLLARAFVNRMWAALMGRGIVHPADEMNARNVPSHPELLEWLARDFESHQYDVKRLLHGIVLSEPYALSGGPTTDPTAFASAPERPLTAEQLSRSWRIVAGLPPEHEPLRKAAIAAIPDVLPKDYNANFVQAQFLTTSPLLREVTQPESPLIARLQTVTPPETCVIEAFTATLGRKPESDEAKYFADAIQAASSTEEGRTNAIRNIVHALVTSPEFLIVPR
jgi:mono/diheme cytochrome c family protein